VQHHGNIHDSVLSVLGNICQKVCDFTRFEVFTEVEIHTLVFRVMTSRQSVGWLPASGTLVNRQNKW
jgi:hypothetical protein